MERVGECSTAHHPLLPFATLVGEIDRFLSRGDRVLHVAESKVGLAEATVTGRYAPPIPRFKGGFGGVAQRLNGVGQPSKGTEGKPSHPDHPGLSARRERRDRLTPRGLKEVGEQRKVGSDSAKHIRQVEPFVAKDAFFVDFLERMLMPTGVASVIEGVEERCQIVKRRELVRRLVR